MGMVGPNCFLLYNHPGVVHLHMTQHKQTAAIVLPMVLVLAIVCYCFANGLQWFFKWFTLRSTGNLTTFALLLSMKGQQKWGEVLAIVLPMV